ncbi:AAA family ATPase [Vagococcus sp. BWB3-3]|uniref:AAA family ATPase n=1 Tax=Vagococcus allomyrinae TaxID=2794353 RepID=A0A940SUF3_9ENTE|nr:AAA family ATPase [Vagococcus allomyrinae]MBP1044247.1 AAA family ATPase [Vagococcus allomyrinae]
MEIIFVGNYKGGVGKTTSTLLLGRHLAHENKKVLLLDLDSQSSLSELCIKNIDDFHFLEDMDDTKTLNYIYDLEIENIKKGYNLDLSFDYQNLVYPYETNIDFIPTKITYKNSLGLDELCMNMDADIRYFSILAKLIKKVSEDYDYVLIDCPPSSNVITQSAFLVSDYYVIPTIADSVSTNGIIHYIETISKTYKKYCQLHEDAYLYKHYFGDEPKLIGVFYTLIRGQVNYVDIESILSAELQRISSESGDPIYIFESFTNNYVGITRAIANNELDTLPPSKDTYDTIMREMLERMETLGS